MPPATTNKSKMDPLIQMTSVLQQNSLRMTTNLSSPSVKPVMNRPNQPNGDVSAPPAWPVAGENQRSVMYHTLLQTLWQQHAHADGRSLYSSATATLLAAQHALPYMAPNASTTPIQITAGKAYTKRTLTTSRLAIQLCRP